MIRWVIFILIYAFLAWYAFQAVKIVTKNHWLHYLYIIASVLVIGNFVVHFYLANEDARTWTPARSYAFGFLITFMVLKLLTLPFLFGEDIIRFTTGVYHKFFGSREVFYIPSRRTFVSQFALGVAAIPFASMLYGMYRGKYNYKVLRYTLEFDDLPDAFDGYQITQISDIHSGSFDNRRKIAYGVDLINEQESDIIVFTGDMVNNTASEMEPWKALFSRLKAKDGLYSVLGNHDYGDYISWDSEAAKTANLKQLKTIQEEMGFRLLLNESTYLEKDGQRLALIGVENWGAGRFKKAGDIDKAIAAVQKDDFKILMSHDPFALGKRDYSSQLSFSPHIKRATTHGMQFGIEIPGWIKWSPVKWRYKYWAGIYRELGQYINVNRGFGFIAYPGRVGIWPEITVIQLKKTPNAL